MLVMVLTAVGTASAATTTPPVPVKITVTTKTIIVSPAMSASGTVVFNVVNPDKTVHEIDIVRTTLDPAKLPIKASGQFNEHTPQARVVKEAVKVLPGATRTFTAILTPGSYVIVDNLPGHYRAGEAAALKII